jgi:hypothetical protein
MLIGSVKGRESGRSVVMIRLSPSKRMALQKRTTGALGNDKLNQSRPWDAFTFGSSAEFSQPLSEFSGPTTVLE